MSLEAQIRHHIAAHGPMRVEEYMRRCLSHYYANRDPLGLRGDFVTSPEISQIFGELVGAWVAAQWQMQGGGPAQLIELGPGRGTLMADCLRATKHVPGFHDALSIQLVEINAALRDKQQEKLNGAHRDIQWRERVEIDPTKKPFVIANEFFDALPVQQYMRRQGQWFERGVGVDAAGRLCFTTLPHSAALAAGHGAREGEVWERGAESEAIIRQLAGAIAARGGGMLAIDYGHEGGLGDTLQAVAKHRYHSVFEDAGEADLTAHVDFAALAQAAQDAGAHTDVTTQGAFLRRAGAELRAVALCKHADASQREQIASGLERLMNPDKMGELFKVLAILPRGSV